MNESETYKAHCHSCEWNGFTTVNDLVDDLLMMCPGCQKRLSVTRITTPKPKWRLLEPEEAQHGDQVLLDRIDWHTITPSESIPELRVFLKRRSIQVRRRMTPAEEHAGRLVVAIEAYFEAFETGGDSEEGHALMEMQAALHAAKGVQLPEPARFLRETLTGRTD